MLLLRDDSVDLSGVIIESERIELRPITVDFVPEIFRTFTPEITKYMMPKPSEKIADTIDFVEAATRGFERCDDLHFVILTRRLYEFLGICSLHSRGKPREPELGIWLKKAAHGNDYGLEAIAALKGWGEANLEIDRMLYPVDRRNVPSRRIAERLGGKVVSTAKIVSESGQELDELVYSIESKTPNST
jgi:ribosomal-protein-alanine N-acetyltransferase